MSNLFITPLVSPTSRSRSALRFGFLILTLAFGAPLDPYRCSPCVLS
jgi:hypothetical protein